MNPWAITLAVCSFVAEVPPEHTDRFRRDSAVRAEFRETYGATLDALALSPVTY